MINMHLPENCELSQEELDYDLLDVVSLQACWRKQCQLHGDDLSSIPLTSTGYMRRELKKSCLANKNFRRDNLLECRLSTELYEAFNSSYAGGYTHNNRVYRNRVIRVGETYQFGDKNVYVSNIVHRDFRSFYPSILRCKKFPLSEWKLFYTSDKGPISINDILKWSPDYTTMTLIRIYDCHLREPMNTVPILQSSKLIYKRNDVSCMIEDNGRIVRIEAFEDSNGFEIYLDNVMLNLFLKQYTGTIEILKSWRSKNKPLPEEIVTVIDEFFKGKTDKKHIEKRFKELYGETDDRTMDAHTELGIVKALLNAIYGVFAQANIRSEYYIDDNNEFVETKPFENGDSFEVIQQKIKQYNEEQLDMYYEKRNSFLTYPIGCLCTSYAKEELLLFIETCIGYSHIIYCDTDSAFYISTPEIEEKIEALNAKNHETAPYVILENGEKEYYDVFEKEPHDIIAFKGLHSKCYGYVTDDNELVAVIAGVPARTLLCMQNDKPIYYTREQELAGVPVDFYKRPEYKDKKILTDPVKALNNLNDKMVFYINTGMKGTLVGATGRNGVRKPSKIIVDGHEISTAGGMVLVPLEAKGVTEGTMLELKRDKNGKLIKAKVKDLIL